MYGKTGDVGAYRLVTKHFMILQEMVRKNKGAIIKTMGDAIMASYCSPLDAVISVSDMLDEINSFNEKLKESGNTLGLKIEIRTGPVIAVKANQPLDYFGQTVNIAARVKEFVGSDEIYLTSDVISENNVKNTIYQIGYSVLESQADLKGVSGEMTVYRCW